MVQYIQDEPKDAEPYTCMIGCGALATHFEMISTNKYGMIQIPFYLCREDWNKFKHRLPNTKMNDLFYKTKEILR